MGTIETITRFRWPAKTGETDPELKRHWLYEAGMLNRALSDMVLRVAEDGITGLDFEDAAIPESKFDADLQASLGLNDGAVTTRKLANLALPATAPGRNKMADNFVNTAQVADAAITEAKLSGIAYYNIPVGFVFPVGGESAPGPDYIMCFGQTLNIADYPALYGAIGAKWGTGVTGTFKLPDLRGYFERGWAHGTTNDPDKTTRTGGDAVGSTQMDELLGHAHTMRLSVGNATTGTAGSWAFYTSGSTPRPTTNTSPLCTETRPINKAVLYVIKVR